MGSRVKPEAARGFLRCFFSKKRTGEDLRGAAPALDARNVGRSPGKLPAKPGEEGQRPHIPRLMPCGELVLLLGLLSLPRP